jgi:hypothetical protein
MDPTRAGCTYSGVCRKLGSSQLVRASNHSARRRQLQMARHEADLAVDDLEVLVKACEGMSGRDIITACSAALTLRDKDAASGHLPTSTRTTPRATPPGTPGRSGV